MPLRNKDYAERYEDDRRSGIVQDRAPIRPNFTECAKGPRCPYPVSCCPECQRHSLIRHTC